MTATPAFHIKTCRNCKGKDPCTCSIDHNHAFSCCNAGRVTLGPMDGYAPQATSSGPEPGGAAG